MRFGSFTGLFLPWNRHQQHAKEGISLQASTPVDIEGTRSTLSNDEFLNLDQEVASSLLCGYVDSCRSRTRLSHERVASPISPSRSKSCHISIMVAHEWDYNTTRSQVARFRLSELRRFFSIVLVEQRRELPCSNTKSKYTRSLGEDWYRIVEHKSLARLAVRVLVVPVKEERSGI